MTEAKVPSTPAKSEATHIETLESIDVTTLETTIEAAVDAAVSRKIDELTQAAMEVNLKVAENSEAEPIKEVIGLRWIVGIILRLMHLR